MRLHERALGGVVRCLVGVGSDEAKDEAVRIVYAAEEEFGAQNAGVLKMRVEVLAGGDERAWGEGLRDLFMAADVGGADEELRFVLGNLERLGERDGGIAAELLDEMMPRLLGQSVIDQAVALRVKLHLNDSDKETIWDIFNLLDCVHYTAHRIGKGTTQDIQAVSPSPPRRPPLTQQMLWAVIQPL